MEKICRFSLIFLLLVGCSTKEIMQDTKKGPTEQDDEFEKVVRVQDIKESKKTAPLEEVTLPIAVPEPKKTAAEKSEAKAAEKNADKTAGKSVDKSKAAGNVKGAKPEEIKSSKASLREPKIEDSVGFNGRRPIEDPYRAGEKVVLTAKYLNVEAGDIALEVLPFKNVNDRKAYHLRMNIVTNKTFNMFYAVNNTSETYLDYETMVPQTFTYDAKESSRIREYKIFFDNKKLEATQWRREVHKKKGESKKKINWKIEPYSQNILSALFYLRTFQLEPGKKYAYRVADEGKNYVFTFHVLRREKLETAKGVLNTLVIRPDYQVDGTFKPSGENTIWVTDDARKFIVQIAAKVKIGTFMLKLKSIEGPK